MTGRKSEWDYVHSGRANPDTQFLRLAVTIPFHIKTAALSCIETTRDVKINIEMENLVRRVVRSIVQALNKPRRDSASAAKLMMSALYKVPHIQQHGEKCNKAWKDCEITVRSAWRRMRHLVTTNKIAVRQEDMLRHSLAYDRRLVKEVDKVWNEGAKSALEKSSTPLPKEFKSGRLRYLPHILLALTMGGAAVAGAYVKYKPSAAKSGQLENETPTDETSTEKAAKARKAARKAAKKDRRAAKRVDAAARKDNATGSEDGSADSKYDATGSEDGSAEISDADSDEAGIGDAGIDEDSEAIARADREDIGEAERQAANEKLTRMANELSIQQWDDSIGPMEEKEKQEALEKIEGMRSGLHAYNHASAAKNERSLGQLMAKHHDRVGMKSGAGI